MVNPQVGTIFKANGEREVIKPKNGKKFTLEELQHAVGGYIELVALKIEIRIGHAKMYVNEDGKREDLPPNRIATSLALISPEDRIVGNAIIVASREFVWLDTAKAAAR